MADSHFKQHPITFPLTPWVPCSAGSAIGTIGYRPDRSFKNEEGKVVCVLESSSTNDRKVGVGELCLADKYFSDEGIDGILIMSLCGKSSSPPRPDTQKRYLEPIFRHLRTQNHRHGVKKLYLISEVAFEALGWKALTPEFMAKAHAIED